MSTKRLNQDLLLDNFSNEIDDLPPPNTYQRKYFKTPKEVQVEIDRDRECKEADFRKWLVKNKPRNAIMTPIETSTAIGVPDIFCCYTGFSSWVECKVLVAGSPRFRGTQYSYLKKLIEAGGHAKIAIQKLNPSTYKPSSIHIYDAEKIVTIPSAMFKQSGQDLIFPPDLKPYYVWYYNRDKSTTTQDLYQKLLLDTTDFTW